MSLPVWGYLGPSWVHLGSSWAVLSRLRATLGPLGEWICGCIADFAKFAPRLGETPILGSPCGRLGTILGPSRAVFGRAGPIMGPSWAILGHLGAILRPSWGRLGHQRPRQGAGDRTRRPRQGAGRGPEARSLTHLRRSSAIFSDQTPVLRLMCVPS